MSVTDRTIIPAQTDAATSHAFSTVGTQSVMADALIDEESITLQQTHNGLDWQDCKLNGVIQAIDKNHTLLTVLGPGLFRCVKSTTAAPVSVVLWETESES